MPLEQMGQALAAPAAVIVTAAAKGLLLFLVAAIAARVFRRAPAATRYAMWAVALGGQLFLLTGGAMLPAIDVPAVPFSWAVGIERTVPLADMSGGGPSLPGGATISSRTPTAPSATPISHNIVATSAARSIHLSAGELLGVLWILGALVVLARYAVGTFRVARLVHESERVDDGQWLSLLTRTAKRMRIERPLTLLRGGALEVPVTWGIVYPVVLLPREADDWNDERRHFVLVHEMAHVKRFDAIMQLVAQVVIIIFWFSPAVWYAAHRIRIEREHACDDQVLLEGTRPSFYANELLAMVQRLGLHDDEAPAFTALAMARRSEFEGRMLAILDANVRRRTLSGRASAATIAFALLLVLPLAALRPARANAPSTSRAGASGLAPRDAATPPVVVGALKTVQSSGNRPVVRTKSQIDQDEERMRAILTRAATLPVPSDKVGLLYDASPHVGGNRDLQRRWLAVARTVPPGNLAALLIRAIREWPQQESTTLDLLAVADLISEGRGRIAVLLEMQRQGLIKSEATKQRYFEVASTLTGQSYRAAVGLLIR
jgi:beta-lactamase regulating signal transducer with metallopeptidase domain